MENLEKNPNNNDFVEIKEGGYVRKEAAEKHEKAQRLSEIENIVKKDGIRSPEDILHIEAEEYNKTRDKVLEHLNNGQMEAFLLSLTSIPAELKNDKEFFLEMIKKEPSSVVFASDKLQNDKELILEAVKRNGFIIRGIPEKFRNDVDVILEAVKTSPDLIKFASDEIKRKLGLEEENQEALEKESTKELTEQRNRIIQEITENKNKILELSRKIVEISDSQKRDEATEEILKYKVRIQKLSEELENTTDQLESNSQEKENNCSSCGFLNKSTDQFCEKCGSRLF